MGFKEELDRKLSIIKGNLIEQRLEKISKLLDFNNLSGNDYIKLLSLINMRNEQAGKAIS